MSLTLGHGRKKIIRVVNKLEKDHFQHIGAHSKQIPMSGLHSRKRLSKNIKTCSTPAGSPPRPPLKPKSTKRKAKDNISEEQSDHESDFLYSQDMWKRRRICALSKMQDVKLGSAKMTYFNAELPIKPPRPVLSE